MMYYSDEARANAISEIKDCISKIGEIPGDHLSFLDAMKISRLLGQLIDQIEKEGRDVKRRVRNGV